MGSGRSIREREPPAIWAALARARFVPRTFHPLGCLVGVRPHGPGVGRSWTRYTGQPFDPAEYRLVEGGWDREYCTVCAAEIAAGDAYWENEGADEVHLCVACHPLVQAELAAEPGAAADRRDL